MTDYLESYPDFEDDGDWWVSIPLEEWENLPNHSASVREFHEAFGHPVEPEPKLPDIKTAILRADLIREEFEEYEKAASENDIVGVADALADILYVVHGAALAYGIPLDKVFNEVHRSNMSKLGADGKPIFREDGKVLKGENYSPPNIKGIIYGKDRSTD